MESERDRETALTASLTQLYLCFWITMDGMTEMSERWNLLLLCVPLVVKQDRHKHRDRQRLGKTQTHTTHKPHTDTDCSRRTHHRLFNSHTNTATDRQNTDLDR